LRPRRWVAILAEDVLALPRGCNCSIVSLAQTFMFQRIPRGTLTRLFDGDKKTANATTPEPGTTPPSAVLRSTLTGKGILLPRGGAPGFVETKRLWPVQKQGRWTAPLRRRDLTAGDDESSGVIFSSDFKALRRSPRDRWRVREGSGRDKMPENAPSSLDEKVRTEKESFGGSRRGLRREGGGSRSSSGSYRRSHGGSGARPSSSASLSSSSAASEHGPPPLATLTIQYNYLAESSLSMIEVWPIIKFNKPQHYLTRWWVNAKRWGLLCDELLELEQELSAVSSRSASRGADSADFPDKGEGFEDEGGEEEEDEEVEDEDDDEGEGIDEDGVVDLRGEEPEDHEGQSSYSHEYGSSSGRSNSGSRNRPMPSSSFSSQPWPGRRPAHPPRATRNSLPKGLQARLVDYCRGRKARVIVIGDVHGCVTELSDLLRACCYSPGDLVLLLGDLVAKGPHSIECIRLAMSIGAVSVRGNHDQEVVRQAIKFRRRLGVGAVEVPPEAIDANSSSLLTGRDKARSSNFTTGTGGGGGGGVGGEHFQIALQLSPREFTWMSELPYFIRSDDLASLFVHAGQFCSALPIPLGLYCSSLC